MNKNFETVYRDHYTSLFTLAFRMTGNREESEDILQTSFLSAFKAYDKFRHESTVFTWLYRIVLNTSKTYYKESRKLPVEIYAEEHQVSQKEIYDRINSHGRTEDEVLANQTRETCLQMFINCMPSKYRAVYTLRIILNFTVQDTADILGISESAVKVNLNRARQIIKGHFDGRCSLIKPGSMCNCRSYAKHLSETGKDHHLLDIEVIRNKEKASVEEFTREMEEILQIEDLYNTQIQPMKYEDFLDNVKKVRREKNPKILRY